MTNEQDTNIFSNKGNFNSKRNPLRKTNTSHQPPILPGNNLLYDPLAGGGDLGGLGFSGSSTSQPTKEILSREVTSLIKVYQDKEKKFGGKVYDMLGAKL
jgi:hypothetical protein